MLRALVRNSRLIIFVSLLYFPVSSCSDDAAKPKGLNAEIEQSGPNKIRFLELLPFFRDQYLVGFCTYIIDGPYWTVDYAPQKLDELRKNLQAGDYKEIPALLTQKYQYLASDPAVSLVWKSDNPVSTNQLAEATVGYFDVSAIPSTIGTDDITDGGTAVSVIGVVLMLIPGVNFAYGLGVVALGGAAVIGGATADVVRTISTGKTGTIENEDFNAMFDPYSSREISAEAMEKITTSLMTNADTDVPANENSNVNLTSNSNANGSSTEQQQCPELSELTAGIVKYLEHWPVVPN